MHRKWMVSALALLALVAAACDRGGIGGTGVKADPKAALVKAFQATAEEGSIFTLSVQSDPESLKALAASDGDEMSDAVVQSILGASLSLSNNGATDPAESKGRMMLRFGDTEALEMRFLANTLYARADVPKILETFQAPPETLQQARQFATFPGFEFIGPALDGKWIALKGLDKLSDQQGVDTANFTAQQKKALQEIAEALEANATIVNKGDEDPGSHLEVTIPLRAMAASLGRIIQQLTPPVPGVTPTPPFNPEEVPDKNMIVDTWVKDEKVRRIEFDFLKNASLFDDEPPPPGVQRFAIRADIEDFSGEVEVPEGAVEVDAEKAFGGITGAPGGAPPGGAGSPALPPDFQMPPGVELPPGFEMPQGQP